jgi:DNA-directed RNA polymerase specialized sigma24 family protein
MKRHKGSEGSSPFPKTRWSQVGIAGRSTDEARRQALEDLLEKYLPALRSHLVSRKRIAPDQADDILQSFVADKVLQQNIIAQADREKGKFRTFILTALDRFVIDEVRKGSAQKRSSGHKEIDLDDVDQASPATSPAEDLDQAWGREVLAQATARMESECRESSREDIWGVFQAKVLDPLMGGGSAVRYEELVARYGLESPLQASNVLLTGKRMFRRHLRGVIGEYAGGERSVDEEIEDLKKILSDARARSG